MPEHLTFHWRFFLKWIGANILAVVVVLVFWPIMFSRLSFNVADLQAALALLPSLLVMGIVVGGLQGLVLADHFRVRRLIVFWTLACLLGVAIGLPLAMSAIQSGAKLLVAALSGLISGGLGWFILRRYVHKAQWWIIANMIASALTAIDNSFSIIAMLMTGFVLAWLVCDPIQEQKPVAAE
jgi:hypothetical protein